MKLFDSVRDSVSATPPAPTGTMSRTGRSGHCAAVWASAGAAEMTQAAAIAEAMNWQRTTLTNDMAILLCSSYSSSMGRRSPSWSTGRSHRAGPRRTPGRHRPLALPQPGEPSRDRGADFWAVAAHFGEFGVGDEIV